MSISNFSNRICCLVLLFIGFTSCKLPVDCSQTPNDSSCKAAPVEPSKDLSGYYDIQAYVSFTEEQVWTAMLGGSTPEYELNDLYYCTTGMAYVCGHIWDTNGSFDFSIPVSKVDGPSKSSKSLKILITYRNYANGVVRTVILHDPNGYYVYFMIRTISNDEIKSGYVANDFQLTKVYVTVNEQGVVTSYNFGDSLN